MPNRCGSENQSGESHPGVRRLVVLALAVGCCSWGWTVQAAEGPVTPPQVTKGKGKSKPVISERPQVLGATTTSGPIKPGTDTSETAQLIGQFQSARESYLAAQKELNLKKQDATEEQRALLREKSKEALAKWQEEHRMYVEEQKERVKQMRQELQPEIGRVLDNAGEGGGSGRGR